MYVSVKRDVENHVVVIVDQDHCSGNETASFASKWITMYYYPSVDLSPITLSRCIGYLGISDPTDVDRAIIAMLVAVFQKDQANRYESMDSVDSLVCW